MADEVELIDKYPEIARLQDDEIFVEACNCFRGEMPNEEVSLVFSKRTIKRDSLDEFTKDIKRKYGVNRVNPVYIEK
jgi:hypothetical protein